MPVFAGVSVVYAFDLVNNSFTKMKMQVWHSFLGSALDFVKFLCFNTCLKACPLLLGPALSKTKNKACWFSLGSVFGKKEGTFGVVMFMDNPKNYYQIFKPC